MTEQTIAPTRLTKWRLNSPEAQNFVCGTVLALAPGMFGTLAALGAGGSGPGAQHLASTINTILYCLYAFTAFFAAMLLNTIGPRWTLAMGAVGYPMYCGGFWYYDNTGNEWFPYLSGVVLGLSAGWLWATVSFCTASYSEESTRGRFLAVQYGGTCLGSIIGNAIALGVVLNGTEGEGSGGVPVAVSASITTLAALSPILAALLMVDPAKVVRSDGTHIAIFRNSKTTTFKRELFDILGTLKDWRILLLLPVWFASDAEFVAPSLMAYSFNLRTRTLLAFVNSLAALPGIVIMGPIVDNNRFTRKTRAFCGLAFVAVLTFGAWCGTLGWMSGKDLGRDHAGPGYDWSDNPEFAGYVVIFAMAGAISGVYINYCLWLVSSFTNSPSKLAMRVGMLHGVSAAGMTVTFAFDSTLPSWYHEYAYVLALQGTGIFIMLYLCWTQVRETNYFTEDDVIVPIDVLMTADGEAVAHETQLHHQFDAQGVAIATGGHKEEDAKMAVVSA